MNSFERVIKTFKGEKTDRIPSFEWIIDKKVIAALMPGLSYAEFSEEMDLDGFAVDLNYKSEDIGDGYSRNEWGMISKNTGEEHSYYVDGPIKTVDDFKAYQAPSAKDPARYVTLEKMLDEYKHRAVIVHLNDIWSIPSRLMSFDHFIMQLIDNPQLVKDVVNMNVDVNIELAEEAVKRGAKICYTGDDVAYNSGPMISPTMFGDIFQGPLNRVISAYKNLGLYVIKHTDGNIMPIVDMYIEAGFDCLDPIDPVAGMDLAHMKKTYGDKIALKGNVDCANTLAMGTVEETINESKNCIDVAGGGGKYIFSSSNSIHSSVKPENYMAMLDTWRKYRDY